MISIVLRHKISLKRILIQIFAFHNNRQISPSDASYRQMSEFAFILFIHLFIYLLIHSFIKTY